jgi:hypothetical protein
MPSPAAGRASEAPQTPTKTGKNPASSSTSKLTGEGGTPGRKPPKLGASKATPKKLDTPSRPKQVEKPKDEDEKPEKEEEKPEEEEEGGISMQDTEEPGGKVSQPGDVSTAHFRGHSLCARHMSGVQTNELRL